MNQQDACAITDAGWIELTLDAMLKRDPVLNRWDVQQMVEELATRPRWRAISPEAAAAKAFGNEGPVR